MTKDQFRRSLMLPDSTATLSWRSYHTSMYESWVINMPSPPKQPNEFFAPPAPRLRLTVADLTGIWVRVLDADL